MDFLEKIAEALGLVHSDVEKISGQIESATAEYKAEHEKEKPAPVVNAVLSRPEAEVREESARETRKEELAGRHEGRDRTRLQIEAAALVLGAILAIATIGQWIVTKEAVRVAAKSAAVSERSAAASESQAKTTQESVQSTVDAFRLDQRAWLSIAIDSKPIPGSESQIEVGRPLDTRITITNVGKTPALNVQSVERRKIIIPGESSGKPVQLPDFDYKRSEYGPGGTIPPNAHVYSDLIGPPLSREQFSDIRSMAIRIYFHGRIEYSNVFGFRHWLTFCYFLLPGGGYQVCSIHNDIDGERD